MRRLPVWLLALVLLALPGLSWGQGAQVINGNRVHAGWVNYGVTTGTGAAYLLTFTPPLPGYVDGSCFLFRAHTANTGDVTLNVNGRGVVPLRKWSSGVAVALSPGDIATGRDVEVCYDASGTPRMQVMGMGEGGSTGTGVTDGDKGDITVSAVGTTWTIDLGVVTYAKMQNVSTTARLLGRNTAGAGPIEELTPAIVKAMLGVTFGDIGGVATDAQIPNLNTLSTGLTASRCVQTDATGLLSVTAVPCAVGGGGDAQTGQPLSQFAATTSAQLAGVLTDEVGTTGGFVRNDALTNGLATKQDTLTWGAGLAVTGAVPRTDSTEAQFLNLGGATDLTAGATQGGKAQVMADGTFQYTDGGATPQVRKGFLTQSGLLWNVVPGTCTADPNSGKLTVTGANQIICAADQGGGGAGTGDISAVGTCTTGDCGTAGTPLQGMFFSTTAAPAAPAVGTGAVYFDTTATNLAVKNSANVVKHMVQSKAAVANQWLNSLADDGTVTATQPASTNLSDSASLARLTSVQKLTQTRVQPRVVSPGTGSPVDINSDNADEVHLTDLVGATTFNVPTGTPDNGQRLTISIYTPTARTLTFSTATSGFSPENGLSLPTSSIAGAYLVLEFRWNSLSNRWGLIASSRDDYKTVALTNAATIVGPVGGIIDCNSLELGYLTALSQPSTFPNPTCTPQNGQSLTYRIISASPQPLTWGTEYAGSSGIPLPTTTTGGGATDLFGFKRNGPTSKWEFVATNQNAGTALLKACVIALGDQVAAVALTNAQLGPRIRQCPGIGRGGIVREIGLYADNGTPSIIVNRKSGGSAALDLVSGALTAGAGGTYACARIAGDTLSQNGTTTCGSSLQNTTYTGEVSFGLTSGTAEGVATEVNVIIFYTPTS